MAKRSRPLPPIWGRDAEARVAAARLLEVDPAFTISAWDEVIEQNALFASVMSLDLVRTR